MADCSVDVNNFSFAVKSLEFLDLENYCVLITNWTLWVVLF